ncbi:MAG: hypothetical protein AB3N14_08130 [Flavobacteriaceae bacterium]
MKNLFKLLFYSVIVILIGCEDEEKLPFETITTQAGTAGGLRTINVISPTIDLNDITNSEFSVEVEEWDDQDGGLLESVDVFVQFQDNTPDNGNSAVAENLISNVPASAFSVNSTSGLPRTTITVTAQEAIDLLGLDPSTDIDGGDIFRFRLALKLSDGSVFSSGNLEGNITGVFFNSPFTYPANVVCNLDQSVFTGTYQMDFISGTFTSFGGSDAYASGQVTITANSGTQRVVQSAQYLPSLGPFSVPITFDLVCGRLIVPLQNVGTVGCTNNIQMATGVNQATFDPTDDSEFMLIFDDEVTSDCGTPTYEVILRFTKL